MLGIASRRTPAYISKDACIESLITRSRPAETKPLSTGSSTYVGSTSRPESWASCTTERMHGRIFSEKKNGPNSKEPSTSSSRSNRIDASTSIFSTDIAIETRSLIPGDEGSCRMASSKEEGFMSIVTSNSNVNLSSVSSFWIVCRPTLRNGLKRVNVSRPNTLTWFIVIVNWVIRSWPSNNNVSIPVDVGSTTSARSSSRKTVRSRALTARSSPEIVAPEGSGTVVPRYSSSAKRRRLKVRPTSPSVSCKLRGLNVPGISMLRSRYNGSVAASPNWPRYWSRFCPARSTILATIPVPMEANSEQATSPIARSTVPRTSPWKTSRTSDAKSSSKSILETATSAVQLSTDDDWGGVVSKLGLVKDNADRAVLSFVEIWTQPSPFKTP